MSAGRGGPLGDAEILRGIREVARAHLRWSGPLRGDERLVETLRLDSIRLLTLVVEIENHFKICLDAGSEQSIETTDDLVRAIRNELDGPAAHAE